MLKVFLVEDEIVVRKGIKNNVNWDENGFIFSGEASDGELAYPMIKNIKPDIVITDIRMPFMNGLELSRLIKEEMPWVKIIILSGYEEFDYAKEAIEVGVTKYLLKPISVAELLDCLREVRQSILKEKEERLNQDIYKREMKEYEEDKKRRLFHNIINNNEPLVRLLEKGKKLNIELSSVVYLIMLFRFNEINDTSKVHTESLSVLDKLNRLIKGNDNIIHFDLLFGKHALLFKATSLEDLINEKDRFLESFIEVLESHKDINYFGGIGNPVYRLGDLGKTFAQASRAFAYRYILDSNKILNFKEIVNLSGDKLVSDDIDLINLQQLDRSKVETFLKSGSKEDITYFVEEYFSSLNNNETSSLIFRQYIILDMYRIVCSFVEELGCETDSIETPSFDSLSFTSNISGTDYILSYIIRIFEQGIGIRDEIATREYNDIIDKAKNFINTNYSQPDLSLNDVSAEVYLSPAHFSSVFSQKTGKTFIQYLTELRLKKAKELLVCTNMRISEIGYSVGYKDSHYFSYLFKKTQNCTPSHYRSNSKIGG